MAMVNGALALSEAAAKLVYRDRNGNALSPVQLELVLALCHKYGLVPELKHLVLIQDAAYVTNAGLLHVAHMAADLDGIETRPATPEERAAFLGDVEDAKTRVWRTDVWRRGQSRPYTGWGKASPVESGAARTHPQEMACTRSVNRALRLAFNVGLTSAEELSDEAPVRQVDVQTGEVLERAVRTNSVRDERIAAIWPVLGAKLGEQQGKRWLVEQIRACGHERIEQLSEGEYASLLAAARGA